MMYIHSSSFHVVGLVKANGSSDIRLSTVWAGLSFFFMNFFFSLFIFLLVFFSFDWVAAAKKTYNNNMTNTNTVYVWTWK